MKKKMKKKGEELKKNRRKYERMRYGGEGKWWVRAQLGLKKTKASFYYKESQPTNSQVGSCS